MLRMTFSGWPTHWTRIEALPERSYPLLGLLLGFGAPIGQLFLRVAMNPARGVAPFQEVLSHAAFYGYELIATCLVFSLAGLVAGRHAQRLRHAEVLYHRLSEEDPLTGLLNARVFGEHFDRVRERAARLKEPVSMLLLDLDGLKEINDRHGHAAGNAALLHVASIINRTKRSVDMAARWGGDEFTILMEGGDGNAATRLAESILERLRATPLVAGNMHRIVTVTIGIGTAEQSRDLEHLFKAADEALYEGKARGRNQIALRPAAWS